jgi:hypothetical protein
MVSGELARKQCCCTGLISPEIEIERSGQVQHDVVGIILPLFVMVNALIKMPRSTACRIIPTCKSSYAH